MKKSMMLMVFTRNDGMFHGYVSLPKGKKIQQTNSLTGLSVFHTKYHMYYNVYVYRLYRFYSLIGCNLPSQFFKSSCRSESKKYCKYCEWPSYPYRFVLSVGYSTVKTPVSNHLSRFKKKNATYLFNTTYLK